MKLRMLLAISLIGLAGCNALDRKCDYLPTKTCECQIPYTRSLACGRCDLKNCTNDTCSECFACGKNYNFQDP